MGGTNDHLRVLVQRGLRWALDQYRSQDLRGLVHRARVAAARWLMPPDPAPRHLYQLDHLAARMRRNNENLRVLVGHDASSPASVPSPLIDVIRAAMSSIEQYHRIQIGRVATLAVVHSATDDLSRLLAELLDNAAKYSPQTSTVAVHARSTSQGGVLLSIEDAGTGIPAERRQALNAQFHAARTMDSEPREQTGLAVVSRLAAKHGMRVRVDKPGEKGTTAVVFLPSALVCDPPETPWFADTPLIRTPPPAPAPVDLKASLPEVTKRSRIGRTTRNGLPRREPHSLREFASFAPTVPPPREDPDGPCAGEQAPSE